MEITLDLTSRRSPDEHKWSDDSFFSSMRILCRKYKEHMERECRDGVGINWGRHAPSSWEKDSGGWSPI